MNVDVVKTTDEKASVDSDGGKKGVKTIFICAHEFGGVKWSLPLTTRGTSHCALRGASHRLSGRFPTTPRRFVFRSYRA